MKVQLWHATVLGAVVGLLLGMALEIARQRHNYQSWQRTIVEFESHGWSPPSESDMLRPHPIPVATSMVFATIGSFVFVIWSHRK